MNYSFIFPSMLILVVIMGYYFFRPRLPIRLNRAFLAILVIDICTELLECISYRLDETWNLHSPALLWIVNIMFFIFGFIRSYMFFVFTVSVLDAQVLLRSKLHIFAPVVYLACSLIAYTYKILQELAYDNGQIVEDKRSIFEKRDYYRSNLASLNETQRRIINPHYYKVDISDDLYDLKMRLINRLIHQINLMQAEEEGSTKQYTHVVVDMLYDFIDGSMACAGADAAVQESIRWINRYPNDQVLYVCDHHPAGHCSFKESGGPWPAHCVMQTHGAEIHEAFTTQVTKPDHRPTAKNTFYKGTNPKREQYSGFESHDSEGIELNNYLTKNVLVSGIATEYCIRETCYDLVKSGHNVFLLEKGLAYITPEGHEKTLNELARIGVKIV